jgi:anaerobic glycerol-3-phosphate dehydrogenase
MAGDGKEVRQMLDAIERELERLHAHGIALTEAGESVQIMAGERSCLVVTDGLLTLLRNLPDAAGDSAIISGLEASALHADKWATSAHIHEENQHDWTANRS